MEVRYTTEEISELFQRVETLEAVSHAPVALDLEKLWGAVQELRRMFEMMLPPIDPMRVP